MMRLACQEALVLCLILQCLTNTVYASLFQLRRPSIAVVLTCRVTVREIVFEKGSLFGGGMEDVDDVVCIKQINEQDSSTILSLADLPIDVYNANEKQIAVGRLYLSLTGITVVGEDVIMSESTEFIVLENSNRKLEEEQLPFGEKTLAIVRISTPDAQVTATANDLEQTVLSEAPHVSNIMSQFREMSFGQITFKSKGVHEVYLDQSVSVFTGLNISSAAEEAMVDQLGLAKASDLADRVLFCVPPGLQKGFIAFTYRNYWRATFSDKFCSSMSATIHEIGHTYGLGHSHWEDPNDYQDLTCLMALGGAEAHYPRQTFNAHKGYQTGWYAARQLDFDPSASEAPQRIEVAALVDYEKASEGQVVIVNIADHVYFQYNRAKSFNNETRQLPDKLIVVESHGNGNSGRVAAMNASDAAFEIPNFQGSGQRLVIEVCSEELGDNDEPDIMVVSVGFGSSVCSAPDDGENVVLPRPPPAPKPSRSPISAPTRSPTHAPVSAPTKAPSPKPSMAPLSVPARQPASIRAPTMTPTSMPNMTPASVPSRQPVSISASPHAPTMTPTSMPSMTPFSAPSLSPSHAPSASPSMSVSPSAAPSSSPTASPSISSSPSASPSAGPSSAPSVLPSSAPSTAPSSAPSTTPSSSPSSSPSTTPSASPSSTPSSSPSATPSTSPSSSPSSTPSSTPSSSPSASPSSTPTTSPSSTPSSTPSASPSVTPSESPSNSPSGSPSSLPSAPPSSSPSASPSLSPSSQPSFSPSNAPSQGPSVSPSSTPSVSPSRSPSSRPSTVPSTTPSATPTRSPTRDPSD